MTGAPRTILPMGERAILVETGSLDETLSLHAALVVTRPNGIVDLVPAARTVLVVVDPRRLSLAAARSWVQHAAAAAAETRGTADVVLDVVYDGPDLDQTADLLGIRPPELIARHTGAAWTVAFTGFAPGFGYLTSADWPLDVPRLASPRTRVPAGAVGLAGSFTGAYPRSTPGGWRLIGTTDAVLFDPSRADPALLVPGARVRFASVRATSRADAGSGAALTEGDGRTERTSLSDAARAAAAAPAESASGFEVLDSGLLATVQDLGRPGSAALGVAPSGALDRGALRTANRLVGNPEDAAGIEVTLGGFAAVARADLWVAVTGAWGPVRIDDEHVDPYVAHAWPRGAVLRIGAPEHGIRSYLAVRGGVDAPAVLRSRSTDTMAGLGPRPLLAGDGIAVGAAATAAIPPSDVAPWSAPPDELELDVAPGPRTDWAVDPQRLFETVWTVGPSDRVGLRLEGEPLVRDVHAELPSEGMLPGAVQLPPDGLPVILLADGPVTGGYPVIGVVTAAGLDLLAQARPGTGIRLRHAHPRVSR